MKNNENFNLIKYFYNSEKSSFVLNKYNALVFKVDIKSNKIEIKKSIEKILNIKVKKINLLIIKGKHKKYKNKIPGCTKSFKKAYVYLTKNEYIKYKNKLIELNK